MQLDVTINDITTTTYQSQLVFLPCYAIHTHSTTYTKFDNIINCRHKESKSKIEFKLKGKLLSMCNQMVTSEIREQFHARFV